MLQTGHVVAARLARALTRRSGWTCLVLDALVAMFVLGALVSWMLFEPSEPAQFLLTMGQEVSPIRPEDAILLAIQSMADRTPVERALIQVVVLGELLLALPWVAFGFVAVLILLVGWRLRWPAWLGRRRIVVRVAGLLALVVLVQGVWLHGGWLPFRPYCRGVPAGEFSAVRDRELMGPMTPEAVDILYDTFASKLGAEDVRRVDDHGLLVRPAWRMIPASYNQSLSTKVARDLAEIRGVDFDLSYESDCGQLERLLMENGRAQAWRAGFGYWPYNTIDENSDLEQFLTGWHRG